MDNLIALVNGLNPSEASLVKHLYLLKNNPEKKKGDRLFNLILNYKITTVDRERENQFMHRFVDESQR